MNCTTLEQSKKLLELGLPINTADCIYIDISNGYTRFLEDGESIESVKNYLLDLYGVEINIIPCWSIGTLLEIDLLYKKETDTTWFFNKNNGVFADYIVERFIWRLSKKLYNF